MCVRFVFLSNCVFYFIRTIPEKKKKERNSLSQKNSSYFFDRRFCFNVLASCAFKLLITFASTLDDDDDDVVVDAGDLVAGRPGLPPFALRK